MTPHIPAADPFRLQWTEEDLSLEDAETLLEQYCHEDNGKRHILRDFFADHFPQYCRSHPVPEEKLKVMNSLTACRSGKLGYTLIRCPDCGRIQMRACTCGNRNCPGCGYLNEQRWVALRQAEEGAMCWKPDRRNEGFRTSGQVQYVALAGNYRRKGYEYTGAFRILRVLLNYEYLWTNLRVLGGAYGCMSAFRRSGDSYLVSYRDPHLKRTLDIFRGLPQYLRDFEADEAAMTKYIIGAVSDLDTPMNAAAQGDLSMTCWFAGLTEQDFQKEREEILDASAEDIRALAGAAEAIIDSDNLCVIGSEAVLERDQDALCTVEALIRGKA